VLAEGGWVVTWPSPDGGDTGIFQQRFKADGSKDGGGVQVNTFTTGNQWTAFATPLEDGGWVVVWESNNQDGSGYGVYQQRYGADGDTIGLETRVNVTIAGNQEFPNVTALDDGGWVVVFSGAGTGTDIFQRRYDADGNPVNFFDLTLAPNTLLAGDDAVLVRGRTNEFNPLDRLDGGAGVDSFLALSRGTYNFSGTIQFANFERIIGSTDNDTFVFRIDGVGTRGCTELNSLLSIDGRGGNDLLAIGDAGAISLAGLKLSNLERIELSSVANNILTVDSAALALITQDIAGLNDRIIVNGALTIAQMVTIAGNGFETVESTLAGNAVVASPRLGGGVTVEVTDTGSNDWFETRTFTVNASGEIIRQVALTDHGIRMTEDFGAGQVLASRLVEDVNDTRGWESLRTEYAANGVSIVRTIVREDDQDVFTNEFETGVLKRQLVEDGSDTRGWSSFERKFQSGVLVETTETADSGNTTVSTYVGGVLTTRLVTDVAQINPTIASTTRHFDSAGNLTSQIVLLDDGNRWTTVFGTERVLTLADLNNNESFASQSYTYAAGTNTLLATEFILDNGERTVRSLVANRDLEDSLGKDIFIGSVGRDNFVFSAAKGDDVIANF